MEIHNCHLVQESFLQWYVGDVSRPHLIHHRDLPEIHQAGKRLGWVAGNRSAGFLIDRPQTQGPHVISDAVAADRDPFSGQVRDHPPAAAAGILEVEGIDPGHDPQCRFTHSN